MFILKLRKISGFFLIITLLFQQIPVGYAIYSPTLSKATVKVKQDIQAARQRNGVGNFNQIYERADESISLNKGLFNLFGRSLSKEIIKTFGSSFWDGLSLLVLTWFDNNETMTNCLRDDIWELQALQEQVLNELFKSSLLSDVTTSDKLWKDYNNLSDYVKDLKKDYKNKIWFPEGENLYVFCPYGEFTDAFKELGESFDNLKATFYGKSLTFGSFSSMAKAAEKRAARRAAAYIKKNKITLTVGGEQGANPRSLLNGPGIKGLAGDLKTELAFVAALGDAVFVDSFKSFSKSWRKDERVDTMIVAYEEAQEQKSLTISQLETSVQFNLSLDNVAEQSLFEVEKVMWEINNEIKKSFETDKSLKTVCEKLSYINKIQCKNKGRTAPSCVE